MDSGIIASFLIFIFIWLALFAIYLPWLIRRLDGWVRLRKEYQSSEPFPGKVWRPFLFSIRGSGWFAPFYVGYMFPFIKLGGNSQGLFIAYPSPLFLRFIWIVVPWKDLIAQRKTWAIPNFEFLFKKVSGVSVLVSSGMAHELAILAGNNWPAERF